MNLKPSVFTEHPWKSLSQSMETETIARNMMVIRKRLGDEWPLTWEQYEREREKDGGQGCAYAEKPYFVELIKQIQDAIGAISFSPTWAKAARAAAVQTMKLTEHVPDSSMPYRTGWRWEPTLKQLNLPLIGLEWYQCACFKTLTIHLLFFSIRINREPHLTWLRP